MLMQKEKIFLYRKSQDVLVKEKVIILYYLIINNEKAKRLLNTLGRISKEILIQKSHDVLVERKGYYYPLLFDN